MAETGTYTYRVLPREVDFTKRATLMTIGDYVLHTAGEDANRFDFGVDTLQSRGMTWVLSRLAIEMERYPQQYEEYTVETWIEEVGRLMTTRNFILRDAQGERIGGASTNWAMIDFNTRQPLDLRAITQYVDAAMPQLGAPVAHPAKIARVNGVLAEQRVVRYSDVDFNRHANSMRYLQWMLDILPLEALTERPVRRVDINFVHETRYGEPVDIYYEAGDPCRFEVKVGEQTACKAALCWA